MQQRFGFLALPEKKDSRARIGDELQGNSEKKPSFLLPILILVIEMKKIEESSFKTAAAV